MRRRLFAAAWYTTVALISVIAFVAVDVVVLARAETLAGSWVALMLPLACAAIAGFALGAPARTAPTTPSQGLWSGAMVTLLAYFLYVVLNWALWPVNALNLAMGVGADLLLAALVLWPLVMVAGAFAGRLFARYVPSTAESDSL